LKNVLIIVVGPTAVGKTELCIELAQLFDTSIISADSRQFYREISIGTAKPSSDELKAVPHYFINNLSISDTYNAGDYETEVIEKLKQLFEKKSVLILTGGSGLFVKAVTDGFDDLPEVDLKIRDELNNIFQDKGLQPLIEELREVDPVFYNQVDRANPRRVIRALEVIRATGRPFSFYRSASAKVRDFEVIKVALERPREELYERINRRVDAMVEEGLLEEVKSVFDFRSSGPLKTVGYTEVFDFLEGKYSWEETVELIKRNTRRFAKRQMTWFRKDEDLMWFHPDNKDLIIDFIKTRINVICQPTNGNS
jgi:tRNA dimethylallyltransferase